MRSHILVHGAREPRFEVANIGGAARFRLLTMSGIQKFGRSLYWLLLCFFVRCHYVYDAIIIMQSVCF